MRWKEQGSKITLIHRQNLFFFNIVGLSGEQVVPSDNALRWFVSGFDNQEA
jgi:hypothetical protein